MSLYRSSRARARDGDLPFREESETRRTFSRTSMSIEFTSDKSTETRKMNKNISDTFLTQFCHVAFRNFYLQLPQIGVMKSQLDLFNNAVIAYFSGNGDKLNEVRIVVQLSLKLNQV